MGKAKQTQADKTRLLEALAELANLNDPDGVARFYKKWPEFLPTTHTFRSTFALREKLSATAKGKPLEFRLRDMLRNVWWRGTGADSDLYHLLFGEIDPHGWRILRRSENQLVRVDLSRRRLFYLPTTPLQAACYSLLQNADKIKVCVNPDCPAPYFVARKAIQRYCSPDCLKLFQRQWSRDWWERVGKLRRAKAHQKRSRKQGG